MAFAATLASPFRVAAFLLDEHESKTSKDAIIRQTNPILETILFMAFVVLLSKYCRAA
jgi:hypothetical protein